MPIKLIALAAAVAATVAGHFESPAPLALVTFVAPLNRSSTDPTVIHAYDTHKTFLEKISVKPPYAYSYGYEADDANAGTKDSLFESRYGDVAFGTLTHIDTDGGRTIVDYTVDTPNGFYAVVRKDYPYRPPPTRLGYARLAAPLSYSAHPSPEVYVVYTTVYKDLDALSKAGPLGVSAYKAHTAFLAHTRLDPPYRYSWGYEVQEMRTGSTKSQYESHYGETGEGNFALLEPGGRLRTIDYTIDDGGFAVATPVAHAINNYPLIYI